MDYIEIIFTVAPRNPYSDILVAELADAGFDTFEETAEGVKAYIPVNLYSDETLKSIALLEEEGEQTIAWVKNFIKAQNWNAVWESSFEPVLVNNQCCIRAPFHNKPDGIQFDIVIEPKMSFGTGHHNTTALMVEQMLKLDFTGKSVLDMGCGTGVLAILAAKMGANDLLAIDIDQWAYENTLENIARNDVAAIKVLQGGAEVLGAAQYDVLLANINRNIITRDIDKYAAVAASASTLLLSGFLDVDVPVVKDAAAAQGFVYQSHQTKDHWTVALFAKQ